MRPAAFALMLVMAACATPSTNSGSSATPSLSPSSSPTGPTCSATGLAIPGAQADLPAPVATMRDRTISAALRCDYDELNEIALAPDNTFSYSFGGDSTPRPGRYWRDREQEGTKVLWYLVRSLDLKFGVQKVEDQPEIYTWPAVAAKDNPTDEDWDAVASLYDGSELSRMRSGGSGFLGYRAGIDATGNWIFFVAGD